MEQKDPVDPFASGPQFSDGARLAFADLGDAVAARQIEVNVATVADDPDRQRGRRAVVQADPVKGDLIQLLLGGVLVGSPHDHFVGPKVLGRLQDGV